jgi:hypothetical protein
MLFSLKPQSNNHPKMIIIMIQARKENFHLEIGIELEQEKEEGKNSKIFFRRRRRSRNLGEEEEESRVHGDRGEELDIFRRKIHLPENLTAKTRFYSHKDLLFIEKVLGLLFLTHGRRLHPLGLGKPLKHHIQ